MTTKEQLDIMLNEIRQVIKKHTNKETDTDIVLEKSSSTGKIQILIKIKNISDMKISILPSQ
ncbi:hypothetical protein EAMG_05388 [Escherichia coli M056]|jgi:hypothetical protein|uniref:hypothetical protein n=1 Tax=Escherichia coli TaxID=562 RepID=UPI000A183005|nr:hypothetical protein [Escherichia coli]OSK13652.1 hypothetical protein EAMG_05388 [Escherichia coli M056]